MQPSRRLRKSLTALAGASLSLLVGSGLVATIRDTAASAGNTADSATFDQIGDLQIARVVPNGDCRSARYNAGPSAPMSTISNFNLSTVTVHNSEDLCVKSLRPEANQRLLVRMSNWLNRETNCSTSPTDERAVDNTCGGFNPGELGPILTVAVNGLPSNTCQRTPARNFNYWGSSARNRSDQVCTLRPNEPVRITIAVSLLDSATAEQRQAAQTDRVLWDVTFELDIA